MSTKRNKLAAATLAALLLAAVAAAAQNHHYRWVDEHGKTVYSDRPPPGGVDYQIVSSTSGYSRSVGGGEGALRADETDAEGRDSASAARDTAADQARKKAEFCSQARTNLEVLKGSAKIVVRGPDGEARTLSPEEVEQQRQTAQSQVTAYCE